MLKMAAVWVFISIIGFGVVFLCGMVFGGPNGMMAGLGGGILMILPVMNLIGIAKQKGFLPLYANLKDHEKFVIFPNAFGRLRTLIMNTKHEGVLYKKDLGWIDDKGREYAWGKDKCSLGYPKCGITIDPVPSHYMELIEKNRDIDNYEDAIKRFLGEKEYTVFAKKFREEVRPNIYDIRRELQYLINTANPQNELKETVFGETYSFKNLANWLIYAYDPRSMENAIDTEKIWVKREQLGYKPIDKAMSYAKAAVIAMIGLAIFFAVVSSLGVNLGEIFGGLF